MILKKVLESNPVRRYEKLQKTLSGFGVDLKPFERMDSDLLSEAIHSIEKEARKIADKLPYKAFMSDPEYGKRRITIEALQQLRSHKRAVEDSIELVEGMSYYDVKQKSGVVYGKRVTFLGEGRKDMLSWVPIIDSVRKLKVLEIMKHGSDEDFSKIYFKMADGRPIDSMNRFVPEHLTESSEGAFVLMEKYCDSVWEGPWPWEIAAPKKVRDIIKENERVRNVRIAEMRRHFDQVHKELVEGEIEQSQVILQGREIMVKITKMIHELGKISAEAMTELKDRVRTEFGQDMAHKMEASANENVGQAVDALSGLKSAIETEIKEMEQQIGSDPLDHDLQGIDDRYSDEDPEGDAQGDEEGFGDDENLDPDSEGDDDLNLDALDMDDEDEESDDAEREKK